MVKIKIAPSILAADAGNLRADVKRAEEAGAEFLHIDIMDAHFVPNLSYSPQTVKAIRSDSKMFFDVHLMMTNPLDYAKAFKDAGADLITIHAEVTDDLKAAADELHALGVKAGIAIKPKTPVSLIEEYIEFYDMVLLMTVEPGFGGQSYIEDVNPKISAVRQIVDEKGLDIDIEVDGGVGAKNAEMPVRAGANVLVAGSAVFGADDVASAVKEIRRIGESVC